MNHIPDDTWGVDLARYAENRAKYPPEELIQYAGQHVAWSHDGTRILASARGDEALCHLLETRGIDPGQVVVEYLDPLYDDIEAGWYSAVASVPAGDSARPAPLSSAAQRLDPPDISRYSENRAKHPPDELIKYAGQYLAWSPDGTRILAHGTDDDSLERQLEAQGLDPSQVVISYEDPLDDDVEGWPFEPVVEYHGLMQLSRLGGPP